LKEPSPSQRAFGAITEISSRGLGAPQVVQVVLISIAFPQEAAVISAGHSPSKVVVELLLLPLVVIGVVVEVVADVVVDPVVVADVVVDPVVVADVVVVVVVVAPKAGMSSPQQLRFSGASYSGEQQSPSGSWLQTGLSGMIGPSSPKQVSRSSFSSSSVH